MDPCSLKVMHRQWHRSFHKDVFQEHHVQGVDIVRNCGFVLLLGDYDVQDGPK